MPSLGASCSWSSRNSIKYLFLKERRRRFMITNPEDVDLLEPLMNNIVPIENQDLGLVSAGDENRRRNNNVFQLGNQPRPVGLPRGFIGSGRSRVRIPANNNSPNMHENGPRRKPIQLINTHPGAQDYTGASPRFTRLFSIGRLLAREDTNIYEDLDDDDVGEDESDNGTEEEEEEDEAMNVDMEADEEEDFTSTPSDLDEL